MYTASQFSIFMVNKPGVLSQILGELARARINIVAMTVMDSVEHGVLRVVLGAPKEAKKVLDALNMPYNETEVLCVNLANSAGALATVADTLAKNHINISYAYCTAGAKGGRTTGVLKVANVPKAMKALQKKHKKTSKKAKPVRRSQSPRK